MALFGGVGYVYIFFLLAVISGKAPLTAELRLLWALRGVPLSLLMKQEQKKKKERNSFEAHKDGRPVRAPLSLPLLDLLFSLSLCNVKTRLPRERAAGNLSSADKVAFNNTSLRFPSQNIKGGLRSPEPEPDQIQGQTSTQSRLEIVLSAAKHHEVFDPHYLFIIHIKNAGNIKK